MNISLTSFCRDNRLAKTTVHERCKELGISTSEGLTSDACDRLLIEFDCIPKALPAAAAATVIEIGNHQIVLASPQLPQTYNLETLRTCEAVFIDDP